MKGSLGMILVAGILSTAGSPLSGGTPPKAAPEHTLHIHLYDLAQVPPGILQCAIVEASRLFEAAGIHIVWERPPIDSPEAHSADFGAAQEASSRQHLVVRTVPTIPATDFSWCTGVRPAIRTVWSGCVDFLWEG